MKDDLDRSIRPNKWIKRGVQPEAPLPKPPPMIAVAKLLAEIREEVDPIKKMALEEEFRAQCEAFDAIDPESLPIDIRPLYSEIMSVIPGPMDIVIPENIGKDEWLEIHKRILICRRSAGQWVSKSRKFAADKWGMDFVMDSEVQMELDLGIEHKDKPERIETGKELLAAQGIATMFQRMIKRAPDPSQWDKDRAGKVLAMIEPIEVFARKLREVACLDA